MALFLEFLIFIVILGSFSFFQVSRLIWTPVIGFILLGFSIYSNLSWWILLPAWLIYAGIAALFQCSAIAT